MRISKLMSKLTALVIAICILFGNQAFNYISVVADENQRLDSQYVSDVKIFYAVDEDSARAQCEEEGYYFIAKDLKEDSKSKVHVYMGYKTTEDEGDAITDLTLLDMKNSHYEEMTYLEFLDKHLADFKDHASSIMVLVSEFRRQLNNGSLNALAALDSLNMFYVDESKSHTQESNLLGNYIRDKADVTFFEKYIQRGNSEILAAITNQLGMASSDYEPGEEGYTTWVDRTKVSPVAELFANARSAEVNQYNIWYRDSALTLIREIQTFAETYMEASIRYEEFGESFGYESEGIYEDSSIDEIMAADPDCRIPEYVNAMVTFEMLDAIVYQEAGESVVSDTAFLYADGMEPEDAEEEATITFTERKSLAEYFMDIAADEELSLHPEKVYPIVASLSAAQQATLRLCGLNVLIRGLIQTENYENRRESLIEETRQDLIEKGYKDGKIYLWENVDTSIYNKLTVETSELIESKNSGKDLKNSTNQAARDAASDLTMALQIIDISLLAASGTIMIVQAIVGVSLWEAGMACFFASNLASMAAMTGTMVGFAIAGTLCCALFVLSIVVLVASLAYMVYTIMDMCGVFDEPELTDYSTIPSIVFHARANMDGTYQVRYDAVPSNGTQENAQKMYLQYSQGFTEEEVEEALKKDSSGAFVFRGFSLSLLITREDVSDLGAFQGIEDRWISLYYSKAPAAGKPIKVVPGESFIQTQKNDYKAPEGYRPVTLINNSLAADINDIKIDGKTGTPLFLFLSTDTGASGEEETEAETLPVEPETEPAQPETQEAETGEPETQAPETVEPETKEQETKEQETKEPETGSYKDASGKGVKTETVKADQYITRVQLAHASKKNDAQNSLRNGGFMNIIDVNLTPYDGYTYIGYQLGSESNALTDIRVSTQGTDPILFGDASYGRAGLPENGTTPDGIGLYATSSLSAGTPIVNITVETKRLPLGSGAEPVCLFSGGNAVDFKHKWSDNVYFIMSDYGALTTKEHVKVKQDDPEDGLYIYFWPKVQYKASGEDAQAPYVGGFSYFLAGDKGKSTYGTHMEFMQKFAQANGFELVMNGSTPAQAMSQGASYMNPLAHWQDCEGGMLGHDWRYDIYHGMTYNKSSNASDGAIGSHDKYIDIFDDEDVQATMYFGVSYTFNPYRAITGVMGLITPYTETTSSLKLTGLATPAGTLQACNVSIQGNPITHAGICYGYYNYTNMSTSLYTNHNCNQKSDLPWLSGGETEVLSRYLLQNGPAEGRDPIARDELLIVTHAKPGTYDNYVPVCDLRSPGDYSHPMNFALDTTNNGSEYIYLYLRNDAGGRTDSEADDSAVYTKKHYIAAVYVGSGRTPEEAIANIYKQMQANWGSLTQQFPDLSDQPLVTELDEILTIDLADEKPWYTLFKHDTKHCDPSDDEWVRGNEAADRRWGHAEYIGSWKTNNVGASADPDDKEKYHDCAYMGIVRTRYSREQAMLNIKDKNGNVTPTPGMVYPVYALMKYYTDDKSSPDTLHVGNTILNLAGGPVKSKEGQYFVYYSTNEGTASFSSPVTEIDISDVEFINGYNSCYSCSSSDRVNFTLPAYSTLRMRTDEYLYFHTKYDMADLPYIEYLYLGIGNSRKEAYVDLIGSTNASAASTVNCNYNSYSDKWIAIGYRRTADASKAIRDVFLYSGDNPPDEINIDGYTLSTTKKQGKQVTTATAAQIPYALLKHNIPAGGSEVVSMNEGAGGTGLYLYFANTSKKIAYEKSAEAEIFPIRNLAFGYGDISPLYASSEQLADVYGTTMHGMKVFDKSAYEDPTWEYILGVRGTSPEVYKIDGSAGFPMSMNYGQLPMDGNKVHHAEGDMRVIMYVDRSSYQAGDKQTKFMPRVNAQLTAAGYYNDTTAYGILTQSK